MRRFDIISGAVALWLSATAALADAAPARVVSLNLCTDQLAMLMAAPGQLVSVTRMVQDPRNSVMADQAAAYIPNNSRAEDVFLLNPDLVLAGTFTAPTTVAMLKRLNIPVVQFEPAVRLDDIAARLRQMGTVLGQDAAAEAVAQRYEADLAALRSDSRDRPRAALFFAQSYAAGDRTLAGQIIAAAGFDNIAREYGLSDGGFLPLELLVLATPDLVVTGRPYRGHSQADAILDHPALALIRDRGAVAPLTDSDWTCGTPHVLRAVAAMVDARDHIGGAGE